MRLIYVLLLLLFTSKTTYSQEYTVDVSLFDLFATSEILIQRSNAINLNQGQWTDIDRTFNQPRYKRAMEYIALNNRTDLFYSLNQISDYYNYLDNHPIVRNAGIKWQREAASLTNDLSLMPAVIGTGFLTGKLYVGITRNSNQDDEVYNELEKLMSENISEVGLAFINGSASRVIVADVTKKYYSPLLRGDYQVSDPFEFDAEVLYKEQFEVAQEPYYSKFNDLDKILIVGWFSKLYALSDFNVLTNLDFYTNPKLELLNPENRFFTGLRRMGYSDEKIASYLDKR